MFSPTGFASHHPLSGTPRPEPSPARSAGRAAAPHARPSLPKFEVRKEHDVGLNRISFVPLCVHSTDPSVARKGKLTVVSTAYGEG